MKVDVTTESHRPACRRGVGLRWRPRQRPTWYANIRSVEWKTAPPVQLGSLVAFVAEFLGKRLAYTYEIAIHTSGQRLVMRTQEGPFPMRTTYTWAEESQPPPG